MRSGMFFRGLDVSERTLGLKFDLARVQLSHRLRRNTHCQLARRYSRPRGHNGSGGDQGGLAHFCTVENDCTDSDQRSVANHTPVHNCTVADGHLVANQAGKTISRDMDRRLILDIRPSSDSNVVNITSHHGSVPDTRIGTDHHITHDHGTRRYPRRSVYSRFMVAKAANDRLTEPGLREPGGSQTRRREFFGTRYHDVSGSNLITSFVTQRIEENGLHIAFPKIANDRHDHLPLVLLLGGVFQSGRHVRTG